MAYSLSEFTRYNVEANGITFTIIGEAYRNNDRENRCKYTAYGPKNEVVQVRRCASRLSQTTEHRLKLELQRVALQAPYAAEAPAAAPAAEVATGLTFAQAKALVPAGVQVDPMAHTTIRALAYQVQDQIDLYEQGEASDATGRTIRTFKAVAAQLWEAAKAEPVEVDHIANGIEHYQDNAGFMGAVRGGLGGSWVVVYKAKAQGIDVQGRQFAVVCEQHGNIGRAHTLGMAYCLAENGSHFCPDCRPAPLKGLPNEARVHLIEMATNEHRNHLQTLDDVQLLSAAGFEVMSEPVSADEPLQGRPVLLSDNDLPTPLMAQMLRQAAADDAAASLVAYDNGDTIEKADGSVIGHIFPGRDKGTCWIGLTWAAAGEIVAGRQAAISRLKEMYLQDQAEQLHRQLQQPVQLQLPAHEDDKGFFVAPAPARPRVVVLCGSTRFRQAFEAANLSETLAGRIVLMPGHFTHSESGDATFGHKEAHFGPAVAAQLDELYKRKIDLSDEVLILNVGGYIGESTRSEIAYAEAAGKVIRWLEPAELESEQRLQLIEQIYEATDPKLRDTWQRRLRLIREGGKMIELRSLTDQQLLSRAAALPAPAATY